MAYQPIHQVGLTNINLPVDYVIHAGQDLSVSKIREASGGYRYAGARIEYSVDVYYRWLSDLKEFNGNIVALNESNDIASGIENGNGVTYGADFFAGVDHPPQLFYDKLLLFKKLQEI